MRYKAYPQYRNLEADYLDEVPNGWETGRLRFHVMTNPTKSEVRGATGESLVSFIPMESVGEYGGLCLDQTKHMDDVITGYTFFRDGDVLIAKITPCFENGKGAIATNLENGIGFGTTELHVLRPLSTIDVQYLFYLTISHGFRNVGAAYMYGAGGQKRVPADFIKNLKHPIPSLDEQHAIATFLDHETAHIDTLISKKQRQIELLQEKRAALISHVVTKGLNPNAKMQDSGIEWLGKVPTHWMMYPLRRVIKKFVDYRGKTPTKCDNGIPLITASAVRNNTIDHSRCPDYITIETYNEWMVRGFPKKGDVVFTTEGATFGETAQIVDDSVALAQRLILFKVDNEKITNDYLFFYMISSFGRGEQWSNVTGTTVFGIKADRLKTIRVTIPPIKEQVEIAAYLKERMRETDFLVEVINSTISLLYEYRTALISAAVTGKIDVREEVA